jgi:hypothetical protein
MHSPRLMLASRAPWTLLLLSGVWFCVLEGCCRETSSMPHGFADLQGGLLEVWVPVLV